MKLNLGRGVMDFKKALKSDYNTIWVLPAVMVLWMTCGVYGQQAANKEPITTSYFEFHSNYWINLHHFLYQEASGSQLRKLQEDGNGFLDIGEAEVHGKMGPAEQTTLEEAVAYYRDSLISRSLLFHLGHERVWLQAQDAHTQIPDTTFSKKYTDMLNGVSPVYRKYFWPLHLKQNRTVIEQQLEMIESFEKTVIPKMEGYAMKVWPAETKVRVDVTAYANYAGAYTAARPRFNIFVSSLDPSSETTSFVETILHEGSHLLFNYGGPFREGISENFDQKKLETPYPKHLWHAALFYLCGRSVQDEFHKIGLADYPMIMDERKVFHRYNTAKFREVLERYYQNEVDFNSTAARLLEGL